MPSGIKSNLHPGGEMPTQKNCRTPTKRVYIRIYKRVYIRKDLRNIYGNEILWYPAKHEKI